MSNLQLHHSIDVLPPSLQKEVADYVAYLAFKYNVPTNNQEPSQRLPLKFGAGKGLIKYLSADWEKDLDQEFDLFNDKGGNDFDDDDDDF